MNDSTKTFALPFVYYPSHGVPSGYSLNVKANKIITIDQGKTATRMNSPIVFNGKNIFTSPTLFRCTNNTRLNMEANSKIIVDNNSTFKMEPGSRLDIASGAALRIKRESHLILYAMREI